MSLLSAVGDGAYDDLSQFRTYVFTTCAVTCIMIHGRLRTPPAVN